jgi:hypothetical protein
MSDGNSNGDSVTPTNDRRAGLRFPLRLAILYRPGGPAVSSNWTLSESLNISSGGLLFKTSEDVMPGQTIEVFIAWPVALDNRVKLKLAVKGPIVRCGGDHTAMSFDTHEFRTCQTPSESNPVKSHFARPVNPSAII